MHAQITPADKMIAPAPRNPAAARSNASPREDLQWLWKYAKPAPEGSKIQLLEDKRFPALLAENFRAPQAMWGTGVALSDAARTFMDGYGRVGSSNNRYLSITGCVVAQCEQRGLLWADLGANAPLLVFAALRWNEQGHTANETGATFTLWLFPNRDLDPHQLPEALKSALDSWVRPQPAAPCSTVVITNAIVVDTTGIPHILGALDAGIHPSLCNTSPGSHA